MVKLVYYNDNNFLINIYQKNTNVVKKNNWKPQQ